MGLACLFGHKWNGCKCTRCGATRDEGHDWKGCKCKICGATRDEGHDYRMLSSFSGHFKKCRICDKLTDEEPHRFEKVSGKCYSKCSVCGHKSSSKHNYVSVEGKCHKVCSVCGDVDWKAEHTWEPVAGKCEEKCKVCGETRSVPHSYANGKCTRCGISIEEPVNGSIPPLLWAALEGDVDTVKELIKGGADVNRFGPDETPLIAAARKGYDDDHMEIVKLLLDAGADVNATDCYGSSAVRLAQRKGLTRMVNYLQSRGGRYLGA